MNYPAKLKSLGCKPPAELPACDIDSIESRLGVRLPESYREFLRVCGGWWQDILCPCREPTPFGEEHVVTGFHDAAEVDGALDLLFVPRNMVMIGYGHFSKFTCLSVAGIDHGAVYALDGEYRAYWDDDEFHQRFNGMADSIRAFLELRRTDALPEKPAGYENAYILAGSFDEFLSLCRPYDDGTE